MPEKYRIRDIEDGGKAKWVVDGGRMVIVMKYKCSKCGNRSAEKTRYCSCCGARMEGVE